MALVFLNVVVPTRADITELQGDARRQIVAQILNQVETLQDLSDEWLPANSTQRLEQLFKAFDKNGDGKLDADERAAMLAFVKSLEDRLSPNAISSQTCYTVSSCIPPITTIIEVTGDRRLSNEFLK